MSTDQLDASEAQPIINVVGDRVALGPLRHDLLPLYMKWINDFEIACLVFQDFRPMTWEAEEDWYEEANKRENGVLFTIYERTTMRPIDTTALFDINYRYRTAEFGILIGEKDCWNKGLGTETTTLVLDYGFIGLGLHNIMLRAASFNVRGINAYTRAGFKEIGRRRQVGQFGGQAYDAVYMDCLSTEFESLVMRQYLP